MMTPEEAVNEHIRAAISFEMDAVVDGYAEDAVIFNGPEPHIGIEAIGAYFRGAPPEDVPTDVTLDSMLSHGEYVYMTYHSPTMSGSDTFQVRDGKIVMQSVHMIVS